MKPCSASATAPSSSASDDNDARPTSSKSTSVVHSTLAERGCADSSAISPNTALAELRELGLASEAVGGEHAQRAAGDEEERVAGLAFANDRGARRHAAEQQRAEHAAKRGLRQRRQQRDRMHGGRILAKRVGRVLGARERDRDDIGGAGDPHVGHGDRHRAVGERDARRGLAEQLGLAPVVDDQRRREIAGVGAVRLEDTRAHERRQRVAGFQAIPAGRAIHRRGGGHAERDAAIGDANARVEVERRGGDDRVVQPEGGNMLALREQRGGAALDVGETDHGDIIDDRPPVCSACATGPILPAIVGDA